MLIKYDSSLPHLQPFNRFVHIEEERLQMFKTGGLSLGSKRQESNPTARARRTPFLLLLADEEVCPFGLSATGLVSFVKYLTRQGASGTVR